MPKLTGLPLRPLPGALLLTMFPGLVLAAGAPDYPAKPIRIVVSFSPGGGTDIFARAMAQKYNAAWGQPVIVDKIYQEGRRMLTSPEFRNRFEPTGASLVASSPRAFAAAVKKDLAKWGKVIKDANLQVN